MNRYKRLSTVLMILSAILSFAADLSAAETASQIAHRASQLLQRAAGINAEFTMESEGRSIKGNLKTSGKKFSISTPGTSIWYDGKTMWTYNSSTQETTVTLPTPQEVAETNPLSVVQANSGDFSIYFAKKQPSKGKRIVFIPKRKDLGLKSVAVSVSSGTYMPYNVVVTPQSGKPTTVHINSLSTKSNFSPSDFVYPSGRFPKAEIVDLR